MAELLWAMRLVVEGAMEEFCVLLQNGSIARWKGLDAMRMSHMQEVLGQQQCTVRSGTVLVLPSPETISSQAERNTPPIPDARRGTA